MGAEKDQFLDALKHIAESFARIARALEGIDESTKRAVNKQWPDPKERREAVVTRIPSEEDQRRARLGETGDTIQDWLGLSPDDQEFVGEREREFLEEQKRAEEEKQRQASSTTVPATGRPKSSGPKKAGTKPRTGKSGSPDHAVAEKRKRRT